MGRNIKTLSVNHKKLNLLSNHEKLEIFKLFNELFFYELSKIPYFELRLPIKAKAEDIAEQYFKIKGYEVLRSRVKNGYRCIGVEFYWKQYQTKLSTSDKQTVQQLKLILSPEDFKELALAVKIKNGTPDLLLIKDNKISFVEVKHNHEAIKPSTVEFFLRYGEKWTVSILRIITKEN